MISTRPRLFYYNIRSNPLGLKLADVLNAGASQKYQIAHVEFPQFDLKVSSCPCLFSVFLQVHNRVEPVRLQ
jgi:hypothetical protein